MTMVFKRTLAVLALLAVSIIPAGVAWNGMVVLYNFLPVKVQEGLEGGLVEAVEAYTALWKLLGG